MPSPGKPGIAWGQIKEWYEKGYPIRRLAKKHDINHATIIQRAKREGWHRPGDNVESKYLRAKEAGEASRRAVKVLERAELTGAKQSPERVAKIIEDIAMGASLTLAAEANGIEIRTLTRWREDAAIDAAIKAAEALRDIEDEKAIARARDRGDWKAAEFNLKHRRRDMYGDGGGKGGIVVNVNVPGPEPVRVVDVTPRSPVDGSGD